MNSQSSLDLISTLVSIYDNGGEPNEWFIQKLRDHLAESEEDPEITLQRHDDIRRLEDSIRDVFKAKGRHNTQVAMCKLGELIGEKVTWPTT